MVECPLFTWLYILELRVSARLESQFTTIRIEIVVKEVLIINTVTC